MPMIQVILVTLMLMMMQIILIIFWWLIWWQQFMLCWYLDLSHMRIGPDFQKIKEFSKPCTWWLMISSFVSWMQGLRHPFLEQWKSDGLTKFLSGSHFYFHTHYTGYNDKSPWKIKTCNFTSIDQSYILYMITIEYHSGSRSGDKSEAYNTFKDSPAVYSLTAHSDSLGSIPK